MNLELTKNAIQGSISFAEIMQTHNVKFAPCVIDLEKKVGDLITHPFKCRDFLIECVLSDNYKKWFGVWGFGIDCSKSPWSKNSTDLLMAFPTPEMCSNFKQNFHLLNEYEKMVGIRPTQFFQVENDTEKLFIHGDKVWKSKGFLISYYSFLLKCLGFSIDDTKLELWLFQIPQNSTEWDRIDNIGKEKFSKFYRNLGKFLSLDGNITGYDDELKYDIHTLHDNAGFVSVVTGGLGKNKFTEEIQKVIG